MDCIMDRVNPTLAYVDTPWLQMSPPYGERKDFDMSCMSKNAAPVNQPSRND